MRLSIQTSCVYPGYPSEHKLLPCNTEYCHWNTAASLICCGVYTVKLGSYIQKEICIALAQWAGESAPLQCRHPRPVSKIVPFVGEGHPVQAICGCMALPSSWLWRPTRKRLQRVPRPRAAQLSAGGHPLLRIPGRPHAQHQPVPASMSCACRQTCQQVHGLRVLLQYFHCMMVAGADMCYRWYINHIHQMSRTQGNRRIQCRQSRLACCWLLQWQCVSVYPINPHLHAAVVCKAAPVKCNLFDATGLADLCNLLAHGHGARLHMRSSSAHVHVKVHTIEGT